MSHAKLTTLMVLMAILAAGSALAGNYVMYGKLHLSTDLMSDTEDTQVRLSSNTSRFGVKGDAALNDDFTLVWQFENAINMAQKTTTNGIANRNTFIGFQHEYGTLLFGIHDTPFKTLGRKSTFFFDSLGDHRTVTMGWDKRLHDVVMYKTKNYEGVQFAAMYQMDQNDLSDSEMASTYSFNGIYDKDGIFLGAALEYMTMGNYGMDADWDNNAATEDTWMVGYFDDTTDQYVAMYEPEAPLAIRAGAGYTTDEFAVRGFFQSVSNVGGVKDLSALTFGGEAKYAMNADYALKGSFYMTDPDTDTDDDEYELLAFGLDRMFGKSQWVYLQYAMVMNGDAAMAPLGGSWHGNSISPNAAGDAPYGISAGVAKKW